jgi:hypothetical protein
MYELVLIVYVETYIDGVDNLKYNNVPLEALRCVSPTSVSTGGGEACAALL